MKMKFILAILTIFISFGIHAQDDVKFYVEVPDTVPKGEAFPVKFVLEDADGSHFEQPEWTNLQYVSGPMNSTSFSIINGVSSSSVSYTYYVQASEEGTYTVNPASITVDGKIHKTDWEKVVVKEGFVLPKERDRWNDNFFGDWGTRRRLPPQQADPSFPPQEEKKTKKKSKKKTYRI